MLIGIGASIYSGNRYDAAISSANLAARFDAALGITSSGGFASAWSDQSGNGRNLLQATGANQPIHLDFSGTKYAANFGVASNYFSAPNATENQIAGDKTIIMRGLRVGNVAPAAVLALVSKFDATTALGFALFQAAASGCLNYYHRVGGLTYTAVSTVSLASIGVTTSDRVSIAINHNTTAGTVKFWYKPSTDGAAWAQMGTDVVTQAGVTAGVDQGALGVFGSPEFPTLYNNNAQAQRVELYSGIVTDLDAGTGGTLAQDMTPNAWTSGSTFVSSTTGETYTVNSTGSKPAQIVDRPSLLFDGAAHYMKCAAFTLNQPETVYLVAKQVTWTGGDCFTDGNSANTGLVAQQSGGVSPNLQLYAGTSGVVAVGGMAIGSLAVLGAVFNGASSSLQVSSGAPVAGDAGASNMGGLTLGSASTGASPANIQVYEALIYNVAHDAATRANVMRALMSKHGVA